MHEECSICRDGGPEMLKHEIVSMVEDNKDIFIVMVQGDENNPPFSYTIGMKKLMNYPEIIVFGISGNAMGSMLNNLADQIREGKIPKMGDKIDNILQNYEVILKPFRQKEDYLFFTEWYYDGWDFDALQMVWPDAKNIFPWEMGFDKKFLKNQPHAIDGDA